MLLYEIPGQFRIVYVHDHREGPQAFCGNAKEGVARIGQTRPTYEEAETVVTPVYVQYRSPTWRIALSWDHVPMTMELFEAFIRSGANDQALLDSSGRRAGIRSELMTTLRAVPKEELEQKLAQAIAAAAALAPWKEAHKHSPEPGQLVWACVYDDITDSQKYEVTRLAYSGYAWVQECGSLAVAPDYFAETEEAPMTPPVRVLPWRPWV